MDTEARTVSRPAETPTPERVEVRKEMRAARGILVGLAVSAILWLALLVVWLAF